jgi:RNA polymerase sigma-70 factor (ECF subfamily)
MRQKIIDITLLKKAQQGHKESLSILSETARQDILAYLYRLTLDSHVAEDLCQETMLQMLKSLPQLRITNVISFWAWLYKTAYSKICRQYRDQGRTRIQKRTFSDADLIKTMPSNGESISHDLIRKELSAAIFEAMDSLKIKYRNILTLRCFQNLSYAEIAQTSGSSELQARLLFFRAKRSLRLQLASRGYKKKEQLFSALSLFAALTAGTSRSASAAASINATSLSVPTGIAALSMVTTKTGILSMITVAACITVGVANRDALTPEIKKPMPVYNRVKKEDLTLLDHLNSPDFQRPSSIGKLKVPNDFLWTDRSNKGPSEPDADIIELLIKRTKLDQRAVILPTGYGIFFQFQNPIIDRPGADIIIAGWAEPPPLVEVFDSQNRSVTLKNPTQLTDTWNRSIFGYDITELPGDFFANSVRISGTHSEGPHQGFELNDIRAREQ